MIYLFTGTDTNKARAKAFAWVEAARKKQPDAAYFRIMAESVNAPALEEAASASGLFFSKSLVLIDDPFSLKDAGRIVLENLDLLAKSPNPIAILAPKSLAANLKKLEAKAEKVFKADLMEKKSARGFNAGLVNALGAKDGQALWKEIAKAERAGDAPEMLHGLLHWKARDLMQKGSWIWSGKEARRLSIDLIELLSDARSGSLELGPALERWALSL